MTFIDKQQDEHECTDFDWFNPDVTSDDPEDEVLACTECGRVKWTAREIKQREKNDAERTSNSCCTV